MTVQKVLKRKKSNLRIVNVRQLFTSNHQLFFWRTFCYSESIGAVSDHKLRLRLKKACSGPATMLMNKMWHFLNYIFFQQQASAASLSGNMAHRKLYDTWRQQIPNRTLFMYIVHKLWWRSTAGGYRAKPCNDWLKNVYKNKDYFVGLFQIISQSL